MTAESQLSLIRHPQYMIYWAARCSTALAYQMMFVAVGWQVYDLTNSVFNLGLVGLLIFLPSVPGTLLVGHVADHYDRRWVIRIAQIGKAICAAVLTVGSITNSLNVTVIFTTALVVGFCRAFDTPILHTLVPGIVPRDILSRAVAGGSMANQVATIGGPALGGFLYVFGAEIVYGICFVAFMAASTLIGMIRLNYPPHEKKPITLASVFAGFTYLRENRIIFGAVSLDLCVIMLGGVIALLPVYARDILQTGPWGLGLLRSAPAVGALVATIYLTRAALRRHCGKIVVCALCIYGFTVIVFGVSTWLPLSLGALMVYGAMDTLNGVIRQSMIQSRTPNDKLGRVTSVSSMFTSSASTLGQFESGVMAAAFGVVPSVVIGGAAAVIAALLWIKLFPQLWNVQSIVPTPEEERAALEAARVTT
jgi:MFS family permease